MKRLSPVLLALFLGALSSCAPRLVVTNLTSGPVFISIDGGKEETIATGKSLERTFAATPTGPASQTTLIGVGNFLREFSNQIALTSGITTNLNLVADMGRLVIINRSGVALGSVYVSTSSNGTWGSSVGTLASNDSASLAFRLPGGSWDLWVVKATGESYFQFKIMISNDRATAVNMGTNGLSAPSFPPTLY
jgi:hypothetical protein